MQALKQINGNVFLFVKIAANSQENKIIEILEYSNKFYLKIKIKEAAYEFKANQELLSYLSKIFNLPKSYLSIEQGENASLKTIKIKNANIEIIQEKVLSLLEKE
ncbi:MAG: DUF167 family protein [Alphaproteobacteria bacterium]|nr:DUF167 family protein [Alphaproteobacteria bacterium]